MIHFKKRKILIALSVVVAILLAYLTYNMTTYVSNFYRNSEITKVIMSLEDVKAGIEATAYKKVEITDPLEIQEIIDVLHQRTIVRTFPKRGNALTNQNNRLELRIILFSTNNDFLEYIITSEGQVDVSKGNDGSSYVLIFNGSVKTWFESLKKIVDLN